MDSDEDENLAIGDGTHWSHDKFLFKDKKKDRNIINILHKDNPLYLPPIDDKKFEMTKYQLMEGKKDIFMDMVNQ